MNYQKQKSLPGNGELNQATLDSLRGDLTNQTGSSGQTMNGASASTANHNAEPANMGGSNAAGSNAK